MRIFIKLLASISIAALIQLCLQYSRDAADYFPAAFTDDCQVAGLSRDCAGQTHTIDPNRLRPDADISAVDSRDLD
jgi:hypothetical protein